jgi:hydrogenase maturation protein HypF
VWFVPVGGPQPVRRARGYAPFPITLPYASQPILACGAEIKNTFCLARDRHAFLSQHIGDMQNLETAEHYAETLALYRHLFRIEPTVVAVDMHPDYMATRYGLEQGGTLVRVQHHHAHLAACLADNAPSQKRPGGKDALGPAIGVIMDGTGYGLDGHIWGGEFLVGDGRGFQRAAHLEYLPLPGGDQATHKPYRLALAYLYALLGDLPLPDTLMAVPSSERELIAQMVARQIHTPLTASAGRLFDAVSAVLGVCRETSYEAQAAIALEMVASCKVTGKTIAPYPYTLEQAEGIQGWGRTTIHLTHTIHVGLAPLLAALLDEIAAGVLVAHSAWRFHLTMADMIVSVCQGLRQTTGLERVALSGGCFQNHLLLELVVPRLQEQGLDVLMHRQVPCNDGGLALGQAVVAHNVMNGD